MKKMTLFLMLLLCYSSMWPHIYDIRQIDMKNGLSNNHVRSIVQDKNGSLWIATEEGLNRFDGARFTSYYKTNPREESCISGNELNCLLDDPQEPVLWIGTQRDGLNAFHYQKGSFIHYKTKESDSKSIAGNDITDIQPAADGSIWIATYWNGIDYFDREKGEFIHYNTKTVQGLASDQIWTVADSGDGFLYIGYVNSGFGVMSVKDKSVQNFTHTPDSPNGLPDDEVRKIYKDMNGNIWVGTSKGLALYNRENNTFISFEENSSFPSHLPISDIKEFDERKLWIAIEMGGIAILDLTQGMLSSPDQIRFEYIQEGNDRDGLSQSSVRCLFQDTFQNVWVGLWGDGINFLSRTPPLFHSYRYSSEHPRGGLTQKTASSICISEDGALWIGTDGGGINLFRDGKREAVFSKENGTLNGNFIQTLLRDSQGNIWIGQYATGANYYDVKKGQFCSLFDEKGEGRDVRVFHEDERGMLWIGTSRGVFQMRLEDKVILNHYNIENNLVRALCTDSLHRLWAGTFGSGLGVYDEELNLLKLFNSDALFPSNTINDICKDSKGRMWVGTGDGLVCFPSPEVWDYKVYRRNNGLANSHICSVLEDKSGNIWVATNRGISCLPIDSDTFLNYDTHDCIPAMNFTNGCAAADETGILYFGTIDGLCYFNPELVLLEQQAPPAVLSEIIVFKPSDQPEDNERLIDISQRSDICLKYDENDFGVTFNVKNYALHDRVEYAYMLKGLSDTWYTIDTPKQVYFRNVPPGNYTLVVKTRIRNQKWSIESSSIAIHIASPIWLTWWAKIGYFLLTTCLLAYILYAYRYWVNMVAMLKMEKMKHAQEQDLNDERLRFYTNITHELRTPLTLILGPLEDMQQEHLLSAKDATRLSIIRQSALRLLNLINQLLEFRKTETQNRKLCVSCENITRLVYEIGLKYQELNKKTNVDFHINVHNKELFIHFDKEVITMILDNLISNALKYTEQGNVTLELIEEQKENVRYTEIKVSDTGYGIAPDALQHIFDRYYQEKTIHQASGTGIGLALVKNLVELHEAEISVESTPGVGSCFVLKLLTDNTYPSALHEDNTVPPPPIDKGVGENLELEMNNSVERKILLVVEDNVDVRNYIVESLSETFEIKIAADGKQGYETALECIPDMVICDIMMPVMNGMELCRNLKKDVRTSHIPVILLTARNSLHDKEEGYEAGADSYLTKPFSSSLLRIRINNLMNLRNQLSGHFKLGKISEQDHTIIADSLNKLDKEFLQEVDLLIAEGLSSDKVDINYLAEKLCMSSSTLYRKMKGLTGMSTNEYIRKIKMQCVKKMLLDGECSASEMAFKVGINSVAYFRQCFKDEFGITYSAYLKRIKSKKK